MNNTIFITNVCVFLITNSLIFGYFFRKQGQPVPPSYGSQPITTVRSGRNDEDNPKKSSLILEKIVNKIDSFGKKPIRISHNECFNEDIGVELDNVNLGRYNHIYVPNEPKPVDKTEQPTTEVVTEETPNKDSADKQSSHLI